MELISVIVPIFRVEKYLKTCVDSICRQTYKNLEIILVDDGSDDGSPAICDELAKEDERIRVIHKENGGLSHARNAGIDIATGEYLMFIDSDDVIGEHMVVGLHNILTENQADMALCDFIKFTEGESPEFSFNEEAAFVWDKGQAFAQLYGNRMLQMTVAWNKLYKRELFQEIRYPNGKCHEDEFVIHHLIDKAEKVAYTPAKWYGYLQRKDSIMGGFSLRNLEGLEAWRERLVFFEEKKEWELAGKAYERYLWLLDNSIEKIKKYMPEEAAVLGKVSREFAECLGKKEYRKYRKGLGFKKRVKYWIKKIL